MRVRCPSSLSARVSGESCPVARHYLCTDSVVSALTAHARTRKVFSASPSLSALILGRSSGAASYGSAVILCFYMNHRDSRMEPETVRQTEFRPTSRSELLPRSSSVEAAGRAIRVRGAHVAHTSRSSAALVRSSSSHQTRDEFYKP